MCSSLSLLDMARYKVGKGPMCHTCVPVSLCFAGADFWQKIVKFSNFYCALRVKGAF